MPEFDPDAPSLKRAPSLERTLSLEQKVALLTGRDFWSTTSVPGLDSVVLTDGPHGVRKQDQGFDHLGLSGSVPSTCFPPAVAVGSSWDPEVADRVGAAIGIEARALGVHVVLGPGVNIKRSPLCGRNFEYYSEDPLIAGVLGSAHVTGMARNGAGASVKHFAANNQETERMRVSADVDERTLREIYLPAFERVVRTANPATVMCSYNRINGVSAAENRWLLTDLLRTEWGFDGVVVSDWGAVADRLASLTAGLDLAMPGTGALDQRIVDAVRSGEIEERVLDTAVRRLAALVREHPRGFDGSEVGPEGLSTEGLNTEGSNTGEFDVRAHHALAREVAGDCAVLLKNEARTLPLTGGRVAVLGPFAVEPRYQAGGSSRLNPTRVDSPLEELRAGIAERGGSVDFAPGYDPEGTESGHTRSAAEALRAEAVAVAGSAEVAVVFAGLAETDESEGFDRTTITLPETQVALIRAVAEAAPRTVVVLANGGVVTMEDWHSHVDAILEGFLLGQAGGGALADLLLGTVNPSGRLAETVPRRIEETASFVNFPGEQGHVRYGEGVMVGYRWHETVGLPARYPFGHGLSYTTFETGELSAEATGDDTATATVTVTNTGDRAGKHVVQLYVSTGAGPVRRPVRELRAFEKVHLVAGESRRVRFDLGARAFAYWDVPSADWAVAPGTYRLQIGADAATVLTESPVELTGRVRVPPLTLDSSVQEWLDHPTVGNAARDELTAALPEGRRQLLTEPETLRLVESMPLRQILGMLGEALPSSTLERLMDRSRTA